MTYKYFITKYKKQLSEKANKIKASIDLEYNTIKNSPNIIEDFLEFRERFDLEIDRFNNTYSVSCPKNIMNSLFKQYSIIDSIDISIDLKNYYNKIYHKICDKFPHSDDSFKTEEL